MQLIVKEFIEEGLFVAIAMVGGEVHCFIVLLVNFGIVGLGL